MSVQVTNVSLSQVQVAPVVYAQSQFVPAGSASSGLAYSPTATGLYRVSLYLTGTAYPGLTATITWSDGIWPNPLTANVPLEGSDMRGAAFTLALAAGETLQLTTAVTPLYQAETYTMFMAVEQLA